jgi:3-oxoacyl-[acyl-carrier-protein] synthase II
MGRFSQLAIAATSMALEDAGLTGIERELIDLLPITLGVSTSDIQFVTNKARAYSVPALIPHAAATALSRHLNIKCDITTLSNACTSGLDAIAMAAQSIRTGATELALAGSAEASVTFTTVQFLSGMMPTDCNHAPKSASRPFSIDRKGGVLAEGACILVLESLERAQSRGAPIYAEIFGYGTCIDPTDQEDGIALLQAMKNALDNARMRREEIDYISAHAPSDPMLDRAETNMIKQCFGQRAYQLPISSIKAVTGNPLGCGGCMQSVATALSIQRGMIPPTGNLHHPDPACDLDYVPLTPRYADVRRAMVNSRGIGGGNSCLIIGALA